VVRVVGPVRGGGLTGLAFLRDTLYLGTADGSLLVYKRGGEPSTPLPRARVRCCVLYVSVQMCECVSVCVCSWA
jgi:hypothetical protein